MKKHLIITALLLMIGANAMAQEEEAPAKKWTNEGSVGFNFAQSSYTNWAAGGQNALNWLGTLNYEIDYDNDVIKWDNNLYAALGYTFYDFSIRGIKTDDILQFTSLAGMRASDQLNYSLEFAFRSQLAKGYDPQAKDTRYNSKFLAPAYISLGLGMEWAPNEHFSVNLAPLTGRITIVNDSLLASIGAYGVNELDTEDPETHELIHDANKTIRYEFGARLAAKMQYTLFKNVDYESKLELFSNYLKNPQNIDVDWQNLLVLKVNDWLNCNFGTHLIYDYDIPFYDLNPDTQEYVLDPNSKVQFKEVLSVGLLFKL